MRPLRPATLAALTLITCSVFLASCSSKPSKSDYSEKLCIKPVNWWRLEPLMKSFGARHDMEFHGGIEPTSRMDSSVHLHDKLNFALITGLRQLTIDDFDLWLVSDPFKPTEVNLNIISRKSLTSEQHDTIRQFWQALQPLTCRGA
jgi:hypothetical protein